MFSLSKVTGGDYPCPVKGDIWDNSTDYLHLKSKGDPGTSHRMLDFESFEAGKGEFQWSLKVRVF